MLNQNGEISHRNLCSNPFSFSSEKLKVNTNIKSLSKERTKIKIRKFAKQMCNQIRKTNSNAKANSTHNGNDVIFPFKQSCSSSIFPLKDLLVAKQGAKLAYNNSIAVSNTNTSTTPIVSPNHQQQLMPHDKRQSQPQINININNINIDNYQIDCHYDHLKFPNIHNSASTPSTNSKRNLNLKLLSQMRKIEFNKDHVMNNLLGLHKNNQVLLSRSKLKVNKDKDRDRDRNRGHEEDEESNSLINELEELLKEGYGKQTIIPHNTSDNPNRDSLFNLDIEPILSNSNKNAKDNDNNNDNVYKDIINSDKEKDKPMPMETGNDSNNVSDININKQRVNKDFYHQTSNSCYTDRPQTSYGGVLLRRFKLKNNQRENVNELLNRKKML